MSNRLKTISTEMLGYPDWQKVLEVILHEFGCQTGTLHQWADLRQSLEIVAHAGIPKELVVKIERIPLGKGIAGTAAERMEPVQMCNLQTDRSGVAKPAAKKTKVGGSIAVPVEFGGLLMGTLGIGKHDPYDFTPAEISDLQVVAAEIAEKWADG
jgi:L-methionine (R)-S-oxide reductase